MLGLTLGAFELKAQIPFEVFIEPYAVSGMPGVHSYAHAQLGNKILIFGGRIDGLHRRQPFASFDPAFNNTNIILLDLAQQTVISRPLAELSVGLQEQLQSSNMQYAQKDGYVFLTGGYGRSNTAGDHITFPRITAVDIAGLITAIESQTPISSYFYTLADENMAVTGGQMRLLNDTFYLVGGNRFDGRYNPNNGPSFTQEYTNSIRTFSAQVSGGSLTVSNFAETIDAENLHRRDYNLVGTIFPGGEEAYSISSGVFQVADDFPFETWVDVKAGGHLIVPNFNQKLSHYHSAHTELFDSSSQKMYYLFYGGMARYIYNSQNQLVQKDSVPFVNTISCVERASASAPVEYKMDEEMPGLLGAGAEFFNIQNPEYSNNVIKYHQIADSVVLGYIVGGINSTLPNIFWINTGAESSASNVVYRVILKKKSESGINQVNDMPFYMNAKPNPTTAWIDLMVENMQKGPVSIRVFDLSGKEIIQKTIPKVMEAYLSFSFDLSSYPNGIYLVDVQQGEVSNRVKVIKSN